ncbi:MAG TPA: type II secretion system F family protein, partial [Mesorhizobium sp.]
MTEQVVKTFTDPQFLIALLVGLAVFATVFTLLPALGGNPLKARMKSVALERDELRAKQRARLAAEADRRRKGLREEQSIGMRNIVDRLDLRRALADEGTMQKLKVAGFRGQNPLTRFLFFRLVLPFVGFALAAAYIFVLGGMADKPLFAKVFVCILAAYAGFYAPNLYVSNRASKRKKSIQAAWPDALDLMLICVESGMSVEAAMRKVADEIGVQSGELAEEFVLTNAELSYLQERKQAYDNLASRTGLESVKS